MRLLPKWYGPRCLRISASPPRPPHTVRSHEPVLSPLPPALSRLLPGSNVYKKAVHFTLSVLFVCVSRVFGCPRRPEDGQIFEAEVAGRCEWSDMGAGELSSPRRALNCCKRLSHLSTPADRLLVPDPPHHSHTVSTGGRVSQDLPFSLPFGGAAGPGELIWCGSKRTSLGNCGQPFTCRHWLFIYLLTE